MYFSAMCHWTGVSVPVARTASTWSSAVSMSPFFLGVTLPVTGSTFLGVLFGSLDQSPLMSGS